LAEQVKHWAAAQDVMPVDPINRMSYAPEVPPPITRRYPARVVIQLTCEQTIMNLGRGEKYPFWTFNEHCPGPFIRVRVNDLVELQFTNRDHTGITHNVDFHSGTGPGGGGAISNAEMNETLVANVKMLVPGLYVYHCAASPVPVHISNGMYGLILVEPEEGLLPVDKEFYVMQSDFYAQPAGDEDEPELLEASYLDGLAENPRYVVFNGREGSLVDAPLLVDQGDRVRIYFGNGGPNLISSFHIIGWVFDKVYREGDLITAPDRGIQTTLVPPGGSTIVESDCPVPGNFTLVDHSIFRIDKGAVGFLKVTGVKRDDLFDNEPRPTIVGRDGKPQDRHQHLPGKPTKQPSRAAVAKGASVGAGPQHYKGNMF